MFVFFERFLFAINVTHFVFSSVLFLALRDKCYSLVYSYLLFCLLFCSLSRSFFSGTFMDEEGQAVACKRCEEHQYRSNEMDSTTCENCPEGWTSSSGSAKCWKCSAGEYGDVEGEACKLCDAGQSRVSTDVPTACIDCDSGLYQSITGQATCLTCVPGTHTSGTKQLECELCSEDTFTPNSSSTACASCDFGRFATPGSVSCTACGNGQFHTPLPHQQYRCDTCQPGLVSQAGMFISFFSLLVDLLDDDRRLFWY